MSVDRTTKPELHLARLKGPRHSSAPVELIAIVLLALSTLVAVTAVSIGIARAGILDNSHQYDVMSAEE